MTPTARCTQCNSEIPTGSPAGLCPKCLLQAGLAGQTGSQSTQQFQRKASSEFIPPAPEALAGRFPNIEILDLLGKGGMGAVYRARQINLDRLVAVKILPPDADDPAFAERFSREARALARFSHPNIVAVYDFGQSDGLCYLAMEYVEGLNLRGTIQSGELKSNQALSIVTQICEALQFAHDEGIIHRDIKPENILIDKRGRVKIADFGLAKLLGADQADHALTGTHQVMGTLRYMAPEQLEGSRAVDHRADIYSLGVVFYELLTGELPLGRFAPPSKKVHIDVRLDEVVLRALEKEPDLRYQHASEVKTTIEKLSTNAAPSTSAPVNIDAPVNLFKRFYIRTFLFASLGWFAIPAFWNLREPGLAAACALGAAIQVWRARSAAAFLPTTKAAWSARSRTHRTFSVFANFLLSMCGIYLIAIGCTQAWDHSQWNTSAKASDEFRQAYQGAEHRLLRYLDEFKKEAPRAELFQTRFSWSVGLNISPYAPPSPGSFGWISIGVNWLFGVMMIWGVFQSLLSNTPATQLGWKGFGWHALGLTAVTLAPVIPGAYALLLCTVIGPGVNASHRDSIKTQQSLKTVKEKIERWQTAGGYSCVSGETWKLMSVGQGDSHLADLELDHCWQPSVFDRWHMSWYGFQRAGMDVALEIISNRESTQTVVIVNAKTGNGAQSDAFQEIQLFVNLRD